MRKSFRSSQLYTLIINTKTFYPFLKTGEKFSLTERKAFPFKEKDFLTAKNTGRKSTPQAQCNRLQKQITQ